MTALDLALVAKIVAVVCALGILGVFLWALWPRYRQRVTTKPLVDDAARDEALAAIYRPQIRPWNAPSAKGFHASTSGDHDRTVVSLESRRRV